MSVAARLAAQSRPVRWTVALGMLALLMVLAWLVVWIPVQSLVSSQELWRQSTEEAIAEDRGTLKLAASLRAGREALNASPLPGKLLADVAGGGPDAQLQEELRAALLQSGVEPTNFKVLPAGSFQALRAHRVEFASNMTVDQLQAFFLALEGRPHFVRIERLQLSAPATQRTDENPRLNVLMEARGYSSGAKTADLRVAHAN
jgi:hypothetical protein